MSSSSLIRRRLFSQPCRLTSANKDSESAIKAVLESHTEGTATRAERTCVATRTMGDSH